MFSPTWKVIQWVVGGICLEPQIHFQCLEFFLKGVNTLVDLSEGV